MIKRNMECSTLIFHNLSKGRAQIRNASVEPNTAPPVIFFDGSPAIIAYPKINKEK
jgi:hypothetical protein